MTTVAETPRASTPWRYWVVSAVAVLWNGYGGYDYYMSKTAGDAYYRQMGMDDAQVAYMNTAPDWVTAVWALGVWGAVLGTILLIVRSRFAVHAFVASLVGLLGSLAYGYLLSDGAELMGQQGLIMNLVILAGCLFFIGYSWLMAKRGVVR
jgi:hypothetical protein